jgi:Cu(I)/Ag(I) efflux system membrane fusion protein
MDSILAEYLQIHGALAADGTEGIKPAAEVIHRLAGKLDVQQAPEEHAAHYAGITEQLAAGCAGLLGAPDIAATREAFKALSRPISRWVELAKPAGMSVMYCPMAKAGWVQRGSEVANPYYGSEMLTCGERVGGSE